MDKKCYAIVKNSGYSLIKLETVLDFAGCKHFLEDAEKLIEENGHVLVDCEHIVEFPKDWVRALLKLQVGLKRQDKFMKLIHLNHAAVSFLKREGMDMAFQKARDQRDALAEVGIVPKRSLDTEFVNPFLEATIRVLKVQARVEAAAGKIYMKKAGEQLFGDISGVIGIVSDSFNGSVVITFPEETFLKVISSMLGEEFYKLDKEIIDGAGEVTNMIFGQAKIVLNEKGYGIKTAIPSIVTGKDHTLSAMTKGPVVVVPFDSTAGKFLVEICLSN